MLVLQARSRVAHPGSSVDGTEDDFKLVRVRLEGGLFDSDYRFKNQSIQTQISLNEVRD